MIHYHGGPVTPLRAAQALWTRRHGLTSFAHPEQTALMAEVCQSFVLDCGAFTLWREGRGCVDVAAYAEYVRQWMRHPGFDFCIIPDVIDGNEFDNDRMIGSWFGEHIPFHLCAPVWHLHENLDRLAYLVNAARSGVYSRVALGSSGQFSRPGTRTWWARMMEVRPVVCDEAGRPKCKLHGLRMLSPTIFSHVPLASADSCNVALNIGIDKKWNGAYKPLSRETRALVLAERIEQHAAAATWSPAAGVAENPELVG